MQHLADDLIRLFDASFADSENTVLVRGDAEPLYLPADDENPRNRIIFAHGFFASALHEIAHWCIAGRERRRQVDYGYWYRPDGRNADEQREFENVEAKPQAIEWAFSRACGKPFEVSIDNLSGVPVDRQQFEGKVKAALEHYEKHGFPPRARRFLAVLEDFYAAGNREDAA